MRALVVGGLHGNEPLAIDLVRSIADRLIPGVEVLIGNPRAVERRVRFVDADLNRVFPGDPASSDYELRRARHVLKASASGFDLVLDFHNTHSTSNDCGLIGDRGDRGLAARAARLLGLPGFIVATYDCINRYVPTCLSVEISLESPECRGDLWAARVAWLAALPPGALLRVSIPAVYRFERRISRIEAGQLPVGGWRSFDDIPARDARHVGVPFGSMAIFVEDAYNPETYGGVVSRSRLGAALEHRGAA